MLRRTHVLLALIVGSVVGSLSGTVVSSALASRNSSGTYSLPAGNPVVSGTTIASSTFNSTTSDIATTLTDSLDRNGKGAMLAPLRVPNGTVSAPSVTFDSDTDTGLYRIGANNPGLAANGVKVWECTGSGCTFPLLLAVTGAQTNAAGVTVTQSQSNTNAITSTGNGTGHGISSTGGNTNNTTYGGVFTGGTTSGGGVKGVGGAPNGTGGVFDGQGTGKGITVGTGYAFFNGGNPSISTGYTNTVTPANIVKAWGVVTTNGSGGATATNGFNYTVACGGTNNDDIVVTFGTAMANANYVVLSQYNGGTTSQPGTTTTTSSGFHIVPTGYTCDADANVIHFVVFGTQ